MIEYIPDFKVTADMLVHGSFVIKVITTIDFQKVVSWIKM